MYRELRGNTLRTRFSLSSGRALLVLTTLMSITYQASAATPKSPSTIPVCEGLLLGPDLNNLNDDRLTRQMTALPISMLWESDASQNLLVQHPSIILRAAQRLLHMSQSQGSTLKNVSNVGMVRVFNLFSTPSVVNGGRVIVGHEKEISDYVSILTDAATRNQRKAPMLTGPSGTGKTEFLEIWRRAMNYLSKNNPEFAYYTFRWKGLSEIPDLSALAEANNGKFKSQLNESPFVLLPGGVQQKLLNFANSQESLKAVTDAVGKFEPILTPDPQSAYIQTQIYAFYTSKKREETGDAGAQLTVGEMLGILENHVELIQVELGRADTTPVLDKEGPDFKAGELFLQKDPFLAATLPERFRNPLAWVYGKVPSANGTTLFLDEFPRNTDKLQDMFLRLLESGQVVLGAAPVIDVDTFITLAGNLESLNKLLEAGGTKAQRDRLSTINFGWSAYPYEVAKLLLLMQGEVYMKDLQDPGAEIVPADLDKLFPLPNAGQAVQTPDGRYSIYIGSGTHRVHINPRTLLNMAMIIASTRINVDAKAASEIAGPVITINSAAFRLPSHRMKIYMGESTVPASEEEDLRNLSILLRDGHFGLSTRDANGWLSASLNRALMKNKGELTPAIVREVFIEKVNDESIDFGHDNKVRSQWIGITNLINEDLLLPYLEQDVMRAQAADMADVTHLHDQVILELSAISRGETTYRHPETGRETSVNFKRLEGIKLKFREQQRRELDPNSLASFMLAMQTSQNRRLYDPLKDAILAFLSQKHSENVGLLQLVEYGTNKEGDSEVSTIYNSLIKGMAALGYSETGALDTIALVEQLRQRQRERRERPQQ